VFAAILVAYGEDIEDLEKSKGDYCGSASQYWGAKSDFFRQSPTFGICAETFGSARSGRTFHET